MIIAGIIKKEGDKYFYYISVFSMNKYFKLYNYELNKIINFYQKEKEQKLFSKETNQIGNGYELQNKEVGKDKGFVLKFTSPLNLAKYIEGIANKKILSKAYLIYEINAYIINEIKILIKMVSLNKSNGFNLLKMINNKDKENDTNIIINKRIKVSNSINNNENDNNNYNSQKEFLIYLIKYFCSNIITISYFLNIFQNNHNFDIKFNKKKFTNLEVSKNSLNFSFNKKKNKEFKVEKSEFKIFGKNINFPELIEIKPKGVINRNGCCYLNAAIQCFYHCPKITSFFLLNREIILKKGGPISLGYLEVVEEFSKKNKNYISIKNFINLLIETDESFNNGSNGNDSKDVILLLLYSIQNELGGEEPDINLDIDNRKEHLLFQDLVRNNRSINSIIIENFCFCEKKMNKCQVCGEEYFNLTNQYFITFNLKNVYYYFYKKKNEAISIEECLTFNCFEEADFQIKCQKCNKLQDALTIISFATLPYYLFIILDRGIDEEFDCNFSFKEQIDLKDLYNPVVGEQKENNLKYSLIAGTILHGKNGSGHTFTFAKHFDGNLYIFNDTEVKKATFEDIKNEKVYLLFYQRLSNIKEENN